MKKLGSDWEEWIINILLIILTPIGLLVLWLLIDEDSFIKSFNTIIEAESQDIVWTPEFVNFNDCRVDEECWNRVFDSFLDAINADSKDEYFDCGDWFYGCSEYSNIGFYDIRNGLANVANTELKKRVIINFDKKLMAIEENQRTAIIEKINYEVDYIKRLILNALN